MSTLLTRSASLIRARDEQFNSSAMIDLLIVLVVLVFISLFLTGALYVVRSVRRRAVTRQTLIHTHHSKPTSNHHRRLNISTPYTRGSLISVYDEKSSMLKKPSSPVSPESIPEIRITFPDEQDETGRRMSGRVVVVRIGDSGIGLEPLKGAEQLPAYEVETDSRFQSIDIERIGGLKEKSGWPS